MQILRWSRLNIMNKPSTWRLRLLLGVGSILGTSVLFAQTTSSPNGLQIKTTPPAVATAPLTSSYKTYTYYGDRYRDPFIPLNGDLRSDQSAWERPPAVSSLLLKGIVQDAKGRMALLTSGVNSYILKGGRLYDGRNRMVKKIAGVIKTDSVVIIGSDRTVREIKTKSTL
jgi:hypothetical protein